MTPWNASRCRHHRRAPRRRGKRRHSLLFRPTLLSDIAVFAILLQTYLYKGPSKKKSFLSLSLCVCLFVFRNLIRRALRQAGESDVRCLALCVYKATIALGGGHPSISRYYVCWTNLLPSRNTSPLSSEEAMESTTFHNGRAVTKMMIIFAFTQAGAMFAQNWNRRMFGYFFFWRETFQSTLLESQTRGDYAPSV